MSKKKVAALEARIQQLEDQLLHYGGCPHWVCTGQCDCGWEGLKTRLEERQTEKRKWLNEALKKNFRPPAR